MQDIESLNKMVRVLVWPLMAAAFYSSCGLFFKGELPSQESWVFPMAFSVLFLAQVVVVSFVVEMLDFILEFLSKFLAEWLHAAFGLTMLTVGLLPLNSIAQPESSPSVSPLWAFACLAWGLRIFLPTKSNEA